MIRYRYTYDLDRGPHTPAPIADILSAWPGLSLVLQAPGPEYWLRYGGLTGRSQAIVLEPEQRAALLDCRERSSSVRDWWAGIPPWHEQELIGPLWLADVKYRGTKPEALYLLPALVGLADGPRPTGPDLYTQTGNHLSPDVFWDVQQGWPVGPDLTKIARDYGLEQPDLYSKLSERYDRRDGWVQILVTSPDECRMLEELYRTGIPLQTKSVCFLTPDLTPVDLLDQLEDVLDAKERIAATPGRR